MAAKPERDLKTVGDPSVPSNLEEVTAEADELDVQAQPCKVDDEAATQDKGDGGGKEEDDFSGPLLEPGVSERF